MSEEIRAINIATNTMDTVTSSNILPKDKENIKTEHDKLSKLISDLSGEPSDDIIINMNLSEILKTYNEMPKKSFIKTIYDKITGKNQINQLSQEDIEAILDIEQMSGL